MTPKDFLKNDYDESNIFLRIARGLYLYVPFGRPIATAFMDIISLFEAPGQMKSPSGKSIDPQLQTALDKKQTQSNIRHGVSLGLGVGAGLTVGLVFLLAAFLASNPVGWALLAAAGAGLAIWGLSYTVIYNAQKLSNKLTSRVKIAEGENLTDKEAKRISKKLGIDENNLKEKFGAAKNKNILTKAEIQDICDGIEENKKKQLRAEIGLNDQEVIQLRRRLGLEENSSLFSLKWASGDSDPLAQQNLLDHEKYGFLPKQFTKKITGSLIGLSLGGLIGIAIAFFGFPLTGGIVIEFTNLAAQLLMVFGVAIAGSIVGYDIGRDFSKLHNFVTRARIFAGLDDTNDPAFWKQNRLVRNIILAAFYVALLPFVSGYGVVLLAYAVAGIGQSFYRRVAKKIGVKIPEEGLAYELAKNKTMTVREKEMIPIIKEAMARSLAAKKSAILEKIKTLPNDDKTKSENVKKIVIEEIKETLRNTITAKLLSDKLVSALATARKLNPSSRITENPNSENIKNGLKAAILQRIPIEGISDIKDFVTQTASALVQEINTKSAWSYYERNPNLFITIFSEIIAENSKPLLNTTLATSIGNACSDDLIFGLALSSWPALDHLFTNFSHIQTFSLGETEDNAEYASALALMQMEENGFDYKKLELKEELDENDKEFLKLWWLIRLQKYRTKLDHAGVLDALAHGVFKEVRGVYEATLKLFFKIEDTTQQSLGKKFLQHLAFGLPSIIIGLIIAIVRCIPLLPVVNKFYTSLIKATEAESTLGMIGMFFYHLSPLANYKMTYDSMIKNNTDTRFIGLCKAWAYTLVAPLVSYAFDWISIGKNSYSDRRAKYEYKKNEAETLLVELAASDTDNAHQKYKNYITTYKSKSEKRTSVIFEARKIRTSEALTILQTTTIDVSTLQEVSSLNLTVENKIRLNTLESKAEEALEKVLLAETTPDDDADKVKIALQKLRQPVHKVIVHVLKSSKTKPADIYRTEILLRKPDPALKISGFGAPMPSLRCSAPFAA